MVEQALRQIGEQVFCRLGFAPTDLLYQRLSRILHTRMKDTGFASVEEYLADLEREGDAELRRLTEALTINETYFFREPEHFAALRAVLIDLGRSADPDPIRLLSAGCSTGEEAYSLAITAYRALQGTGRRFEVVGLDIDQEALSRAREALYGRWSFREDGLALAEGFVAAEGDKWRVRPGIRQSVRFEPMNLAEGTPPGPFHVVFCRNMLMYLDTDHRSAVVSRLVSVLPPGGVLFIGASETLQQLPEQLERVALSATYCYRRKPAVRAAGLQETGSLRVLLVSRSPAFRITVRQIIRSEPGMEIVADVPDYESAVKRFGGGEADLVLLDASASGLDAPALAGAQPANALPTLVVTGPAGKTLPVAAPFQVLALPADGVEALKGQAQTLVNHIRRFRRDGRRLPGSVGTSVPKFDRLLVIGSSTGGPPVVSEILSQLPLGLGLAVVIVQHMPAGFTATFAGRLARVTEYQAIEAASGIPLQADKAYVAPGGHNTLVGAGGVLRVMPPVPGDIYVPNIDRTFHSLVTGGPASRTLAVVLTGMGRDGADGLSALAAAGAETFAQDPEEAVVPGMIKAAIDRGAVRRVLQLVDLPKEIAAWANGPRRSVRKVSSSER